MARSERGSSTHGTSSYSGLTKTQRIARAGKVLCGSYPLDKYVDAELFAVQCGVLFEKYDIEIVEYLTNVTNPNCLQLVHKFPPTLQEIGAALEEEKVRRERRRQQESQPRPSRYLPREIPSHPGCRANIKVHRDAPQYPAVLAFTQLPDADPRDWRAEGDCVWISHNAWHELFSSMTRCSSWKPFSDAELRAFYGQAEAAAKAGEQHEAV